LKLSISEFPLASQPVRRNPSNTIKESVVRKLKKAKVIVAGIKVADKINRHAVWRKVLKILDPA
jgi:hypothetical protein